MGVGNGRVLLTGWRSGWTALCLAALVVEAGTGLLVTFFAFHAAVQWGLLLHTALGLALLAPLTWYVWRHWLDYRRYNLSDTVLLGYVAGAALFVCSASGLVVTAQGLLGTRMSTLWRQAHLWSTWAVLGAAGVHLALALVRSRREAWSRVLRPAGWVAAAMAVCALAVGGLAARYAGPEYHNEFPADY